MFYQAFAGVPEWAPAGENHILYSDSVLKNVSYQTKQIRYTATQATGADYLRVTFSPTHVTLAGAKLVPVADGRAKGYTLRKIAQSDHALTINRMASGQIVIQ